MRLLDGFLARRRVEALRSAASLGEEELQRIVDELVAMGPAAIRPASECLAHGEARKPALDVLARLLRDESFDEFLELLASPNPTIVSGVSRVLSSTRTFTPRRILTALETSSLPCPVLEPILRAHAGSIAASDMVGVFPALPRDGQAAILRTLGQVNDPSIVRHVARLIEHEDAAVRVGIVRFLADHPGPCGIPALTGVLHDPDRAVRYEAVKALHGLGDRSAVPALVGALEDGDPNVRAAAVDALRVLGDASCAPGLVELLANESEGVRRAAVEVLDEVATPKAIEELVRVVRDQDVLMRAASALGALNAERVVVAMVVLMQDPDDTIRRLAIEILNAVPDSGALPTLVTALKDPDWWVRERAIDALGKTRDERAIEPLLGQLALFDRTAVLCVRALGLIGHARTLRSIGGLVDSPLADVRREALQVLAAFPREGLAPADLAWLNETLSRAQASGTPSGIARPAVRTRPASSGSLLAPLPLSGMSGALPPPLPPPTFAPVGRDSAGLPPHRREGLSAPSLNFADLREGQELLDRYRIVRKIGRGGFGTVYLAHDAAIQEDIILKMLNPQLALDEAAARRFVQELKLARRVSHRGVIRIHDFIDLGGTRAISMEYFPGRDLGRVLDDEGPLPPRRVLRIAAQVCDGLAAAHHEGVVHRDIKPGNILVGEQDETRLVDFGLASAQVAVEDVARLTQSGLLIGTPEYMAPEQITGDTSDHRVDLYSLGVVLYEVLSGHKPFTAETPVKVLFQHLEGEAVPLRQHVPELPEAVEAVVALAMVREPDRRVASATELRAAIDRAAATLGEGA